MAQARQLTPMPAATHETLIGLLAVTGLRVGEAIRLDRADIDWTDAVLTIRESKFGKTRMVPVLDSTLDMLGRYARIRGRLCPQAATASFFVSTAGTRLIYACVGQVFRRLRDRAAIGAGADRPPRIHDLRHTFAVRTLLGWYQAGRGRRGPAAGPVDLPRSSRPALDLLVPVGGTGTAGAGRPPARAVTAGGTPMTSIAPTLQGFFTERLVSQRRVSSRTIASYRDSLKLLLAFAQQATGKPPNALDWADLDAELITAFLEHLETGRHNTTRTRNLRLTAIRSLFTYAALRHPEHAALIQQVLAIPAKRFSKQLITFLTQAEIDALLAACDLTRWEGRRDRALLLVAAQTGLRVSELTGLNCGDVTLGTGASVRCLGKGRKHRAVPLTTPTQAVLRVWMTERAGLARPAAVPHPHRTAPQRRRRPAPRPPARCRRRPPLPVDPAGQAAPPHPAAQLRHDPAARRRRHRRHRALARPR